MKIIVVGIGKLGEYLSKSLVRDGNDVTLVDLDFTTSRTFISNEDVKYITGNGLNSEILSEAGVEKSDLTISVMDSDEKNIMCSLLAKKMGSKHTIARIRNRDNNDSAFLLKKEIGLSYIINPEYLTALNIAKALSIPSALETTTFLRGRLQMISLKVKEGSVLDGMSLSALDRKNSASVIVCAVLRDGVIIIPKGKFKLKAGDKINVVGTIKDIREFLDYADLISNKTKKVIIAGGSTTSVYLARFLTDMKIKVKIIEINPDRCKELSELLDKTLIINGDISNQNILYEEGIEEADAFISLTSIDEENIVYSMFASLRKVPRIITKVNHIDLDGVIEAANIDTVITPHRIATDNIVQFVRALENSKKSSCEAIYTFDDDQVVIQEFVLKDDFKKTNTKLKDLNIREDVLIIAIQRGKNIIIPNGNTVIKENDTVVLIDNTLELKDINDILE